MAKKKSASAPKKPTPPAAGASPVDAVTHKHARTNLPTRELACFAAGDEKAPKTMDFRRWIWRKKDWGWGGRETFGRGGWHGRETVPQREAAGRKALRGRRVPEPGLSRAGR
jgi:hypothetical protein